jgi:hypothetical protein
VGYAPTEQLHRISGASSQTFDEIRPAAERGVTCSLIMRARIHPRTRVSLLSFAVAFGCLACAPDKGPGTLVVDYTLGNNKTCEELGIERVEVTAYQGTLEDPTFEQTESLLCDNAGTATVPNLEPGIYSVSVVAFDGQDVAIFDNEGQTATERRVEIFEAAEASIDAELTARPAQLQIAWRIGEGGFGNCAGIGVDHFEITAYETGGGTVLLDTVLDCDLIGDAMGFRLVPDPERALNGTSFGEVGFQGVDTAGNPVGSAAAFVFMPPGAGYPVELRIECTEMGCYEQP